MLATISQYLRRTGLSDWAFGTRCMGDGRLMKELRQGRQLSEKSKAKIRAFILANPDG